MMAVQLMKKAMLQKTKCMHFNLVLRESSKFRRQFNISLSQLRQRI